MALDLSQISGAEFLAMPVEEQRRVLTDIYRELFWSDVQSWSQDAITVLDELGVNDYEKGRANIEIPLAFLQVSGVLLHQCFTEQHRNELQVLSEDTQFAASLSESIYDTLSEIRKLTKDVLTLQGYYHAALAHRKESNVNLLDADGNTKPYAPEVIEKEQLLAEQREQEWKERLRAQRAELERVYWGKQKPAPLEEGYDSAQLVLPLWSAGFAVV